MSKSEFSDFCIVSLCAILVVGGFSLAVIGGVLEEREWVQFAATHDCAKVGEMKGNPDRIGWRCNDGVTYWR
jgi:hypothetical protein